MKKKLTCLILSIVMLLSIVPTAFAYTHEEEFEANMLHELGLFNGKGTTASGQPDYSLGSIPTRAESVTMLVRLLGKENEATSGTWNIPFTDVPKWAVPYVGYAYANKLTTGISETLFSGDAPITNTQYITLVLRALGYQSGVDFQWDRAWILSDQLKITNGNYVIADIPFSRGDVVEISYNALKAQIKGTTQTLAEKLISEGVFSQEKYNYAFYADPSAQGYTLTKNDMGTYYWDCLLYSGGANTWMKEMLKYDSQEAKDRCISVARNQCLLKMRECINRIISVATTCGYSDVISRAELLRSAVDMVLSDSISTQDFPQQFNNFMNIIEPEDNPPGMLEELGIAIESHDIEYPPELTDFFNDYLNGTL